MKSNFWAFLTQKRDTYTINIGNYQKKIGNNFRAGLIYVGGIIYLLPRMFEPIEMVHLITANMVAFFMLFNVMNQYLHSGKKMKPKHVIIGNVILGASLIIMIPSVLYGVILGFVLNGLGLYDIYMNPQTSKIKKKKINKK